MPQRNVPLGPWPLGINNSAREHALPAGAALDALNLDILDDGRVVSRHGYSQTQAIDGGHSLKTLGGKTLLCTGSTLGVITAVNPLVMTTLRTGLDSLPISYAERGGEVWWSNGVQSGRCNADNTDAPWCVPAPANLTTVYAGAGTLHPGEYRIAVTHAMANGEESVASEVFSYTLASTGGIVVVLPAPGTADVCNVYCTRANGQTLQKYVTTAASTELVVIASAPEGRQLRDRAFLKPLPPGKAICFHGGRLLVLDGEFLYYSRPYDYGVYDPAQDYLVLGSEGSILASVESGLFVAADRTWFYAGADIASAEPQEKLDYGAARGTVFNPPLHTEPTAGWYSDKGVVIGSDDGTVALVQRDKGFMAPQAQSGAAWVRQRDGRVHVVVSLDDTAAYSRQVSADFTAARMRYDDDATTVCMNLVNNATSRYANWYFNSYANFNGEEYGCDNEGLRLLEGDDDEGAAIVSTLDCGVLGHNSQQIKSPRCIYVTGKSAQPLVVDVVMQSGDIHSYPARSNSEDLAVQRHDCGRGLLNERQQGFNVVVRNEDGVSMEVFGAEVLLTESTRRI